MKVMLVGKGGRESALGWALARSPLVTELVSAPGNPGLARFGDCVEVSADDVDGLVDLATRLRPDLVLVGPEAPLVAGLADALADKGLQVFGPGRDGARLEGSKSFAKWLMRSAAIPTAPFSEFDRTNEAIEYAASRGGRVVVKADGLAAGKGVTVCDDMSEAREAIVGALEGGRFGAAGSKILIEARMHGPELSMLMFFDGKTLLMMEAARDYKRAYDADRGPNTGGMGSFSPVADMSEDVRQRIEAEIMEPTAEALRRADFEYRGVIYAGIMLTDDGPKVVEYNCRFGDPEAQALIPRLDTDLAESVLACARGELEGLKLGWSSQACVAVVAASSGYPGEYQVGRAISGIEDAERVTGIPVFHADTRQEGGDLVTAGGRVLSVSALGQDIEEARRIAYRAVGKINFEGIRYRTDIGAVSTGG